MVSRDVTTNSSQTSTRFTRPGMLRGLQVIFFTLAALSVVRIIVTLPDYYNLWFNGSDYFAKLTHTDFASFGITPQSFAIYNVVVIALCALFSTGIGLFIFWKRPDDWIAVLMAVSMVTQGAVAGIVSITRYALARMLIVAAVANTPGPSALDIVLLLGHDLGIGFALLLFPDGRYAPRWMRKLVWPYVLWLAVYFLALIIPVTPAGSRPIQTALQMAGYPVILAFWIIMFIGRVQRFRTATDPLQRQQTKVLLEGGIFVILVLGLNVVLTPFILRSTGIPVILFIFIGSPLLYYGGLCVLLVALGVTVLRYRLWEIDLIVNRSLVYGVLTLLLGLIFLVVLFPLQAFLQAIIGGQQTTVAAMIAGGACVGLFTPTRRRLQHFVDRRIFKLSVGMSQISTLQKSQPINMANAGTLSGHNLGLYEVGEVLSRGGMGEVYKGRHPSLERSVAIKVLWPDLADNVEFRTRFEREAKIVAGLRHPNIVTVFDSGSIDTTFYIVMEYLSGITLSDYLKQQGPLSLNDAVPLVTDIANALDYAHQQGLVHRDIKPSNVMLQPITSAGPILTQQRAILMDFGITKMAEAESKLTNTGAIGTVDYMAPEQIVAAHGVDRRADIYALGVMTYQMVTGSLPFKSDNLAQVLFGHLNHQAPDPRDLRPDLPEFVAKAILKALSKSPEDRPQSAGEFAASLSAS